MDESKAKKLAKKYVEYVSHTMKLEGQGISDEENEEMVKRYTKMFIENCGENMSLQIISKKV